MQPVIVPGKLHTYAHTQTNMRMDTHIDKKRAGFHSLLLRGPISEQTVLESSMWEGPAGGRMMKTSHHVM